MPGPSGWSGSAGVSSLREVGGLASGGAKGPPAYDYIAISYMSYGWVTEFAMNWS